MKLRSLVIPLVACAALLGTLVPRAQADDDLHVIYQEGRAAFFAGQYELAREKLSVVLAKNPTHLETRAMMAQIEQKIGADNTLLRNTYGKLIIPKIEFTDVELGEAVQALRILSQKASDGKVVPNIIIKNPDLAKKNVSLSLSQIPLSEVINYLAEMTGAKVNYAKAAVMLSSP